VKITRNFSEENMHNKWVKAEIEVTEDDLITVLAEAELPKEALESLTAREKFLILNSLAESCLLEQRVFASVQPASEVEDRIRSFNNIQSKIVEKLKAQYVPF
jgi:hypothetical protein